MKKILIPGIFCILSFYAFSQNLDLVETKAGESYACKIDSITKTEIFYKIKSGSDSWVQTVHGLDEIVRFEYQTVDPKQYKMNYGSSLIQGLKNQTAYKYLKEKYSFKNYAYAPDDKYNPSTATFLGVFPTFGHLYTQEYLRGLTYLGGMGGSFFVFVIGFSMAWGGNNLGSAIAFAGLGGVAGFYIASIVDATRIAKVKSLAHREGKMTLNIRPDFKFGDNQFQANNFGVSVRVNF